MKDLLEIADQVVAKAEPNEDIEAFVESGQETEIRIYQGELESHTSAVSQGIGVRILKDHRQGFAFTKSLEPEMIERTIQEARDNIALGTQDEHLYLAEPDDVKRADLNLYDESLDLVNIEDKIAMATELESAILKGHPRIVGVETAEYGDNLSSMAVATTTGIRETARESGCHLVAYSLAREESEDSETETGFGYSIGKNFEELDYKVAADQAVDRAIRMLGAKKPASFTTDVVLDPWVTAQFLSIIGGTLSGEAVVKGRSLFADRLDEKVAAEDINLIDDPTNSSAPSATEIDGEGLATRRNSLIEGGVLNRFLHNSYTARRLGTASTGSAVRGYSSTSGVRPVALFLEPGKKSQPEIISGLNEGVLIQGVSGLHSGVNPVSGDFSTGAEGLLIKNGELAGPVREFTIGSTLQKMLLNIAEVGSDLEWLPMSSAGLSLLIKEVTISGD